MGLLGLVGFGWVWLGLVGFGLVQFCSVGLVSFGWFGMLILKVITELLSDIGLFLRCYRI